jgi:copper(I)-binding protein
MSLFLRGPAAAFFCLSLPSLAGAHAVLEPRMAAPGLAWEGAVVIGHGCDDTPTTAIRLTLPEGATNAKPADKPGWTVSLGGRDLVWTGGSLPPKERGTFPFMATWSGGKIGDRIYVPIVQTCGTKVLNWTGVPAAGQTAQDVKEPAAALSFVAADAVPRIFHAGPLAIDQPWSRATPKGAPVAGGYLRVTNSGTAADRLIGASFALAAKGEVHEMSMDNGVMRMKQVPGIEIPPGTSVELKPGGYHLMFLNLRDQIAEGARVKGTLVFETAGTVGVDFQVRAMNAGGGGEHQH